KAHALAARVLERVWRGAADICGGAWSQITTFLSNGDPEATFEDEIGLIEPRMDVQRRAGEVRRGAVVTDELAGACNHNPDAVSGHFDELAFTGRHQCMRVVCRRHVRSPMVVVSVCVNRAGEDARRETEIACRDHNGPLSRAYCVAMDVEMRHLR